MTINRGNKPREEERPYQTSHQPEAAINKRTQLTICDDRVRIEPREVAPPYHLPPPMQQSISSEEDIIEIDTSTLQTKREFQLPPDPIKWLTD